MTDHQPPQVPGPDAVSWNGAADSLALQRLLAAASAPGHDDELVGLASALTAFSRATPTSRKKSMISSLIAKLLAAKALTAAAGATALGGVVLAAAATGSLPAPLQNTAHDLGIARAASTSAPATSTRTEATATPNATVSADTTATPDATVSPDTTATPDASVSPDTTATPDATASVAPSTVPTPNMLGLCHAYGAGVASSSGKALDNPAFTVLITAAGSKDGVTAYCATVLGATTGGRPTALPTQAQAHRPTQASSHPTGAPASHPTGAQASHPTGAQASHPTRRQ